MRDRQRGVQTRRLHRPASGAALCARMAGPRLRGGPDEWRGRGKDPAATCMHWQVLLERRCARAPALRVSEIRWQCCALVRCVVPSAVPEQPDAVAMRAGRLSALFGAGAPGLPSGAGPPNGAQPLRLLKACRACSGDFWSVLGA